jgi:hypothetical protein
MSGWNFCTEKGFQNAGNEGSAFATRKREPSTNNDAQHCPDPRTRPERHDGQADTMAAAATTVATPMVACGGRFSSVPRNGGSGGIASESGGGSEGNAAGGGDMASRPAASRVAYLAALDQAAAAVEATSPEGPTYPEPFSRNWSCFESALTQSRAAQLHDTGFVVIDGVFGTPWAGAFREEYVDVEWHPFPTRHMWNGTPFRPDTRVWT